MKKKKFTPTALSTVLLLLLAQTALADDGSNLQIIGTILSRSCDVASESQNQSVDIGRFNVGAFTQVGTTSTAKPFSIHLLDCGSAATGAKLMFSGTGDSADPALLALSDTSGTGGMAVGVAIEILDNAQQPLSLNTLSSSSIALTSGDNTLAFYLRYKSTQSVVTPGNASAVMYFDLQYQ